VPDVDFLRLLDEAGGEMKRFMPESIKEWEGINKVND
jgi:hypothetical protein